MSHQLLFIIWVTISAIPAIVPLLMLPLVGVVSTRVWKPLAVTQQTRWQGRIAQGVALVIVLFIALDWGLLTALPSLGLSFGPVGLPLLGMMGIRLLLLICLAGIVRWGGKIWPKLTALRSGLPGLIIIVVLNLGVLALEFEGLYREPFDLRVTELNIPGPAFLPDRPLRIVQLSDLHIERITNRERNIIETVTRLEPDIIVLTGDYLNTSYTYDLRAREEARTFLAQLHAPYGVYAVIANPVEPPEVASALFAGLDIQVLADKIQPLSFDERELYLVGVTYTEYLKRERDEAALATLMAQVPPKAYSILLYHTPDIVQAAAAEKVDLYLAGHTHGGQIRLPLYGAVITASEFGKRYEQGRYLVDATILHVSRGLGMEGKGAPRARFLCPPEIVVVNVGTN